MRAKYIIYFCTLVACILSGQIAFAQGDTLVISDTTIDNTNVSVVGSYVSALNPGFEQVSFGTWARDEPEMWITVDVPIIGWILVSFDGTYAYVIGSRGSEIPVPTGDSLCKCNVHLASICRCENWCGYRDEDEDVTGECSVFYE